MSTPAVTTMTLHTIDGVTHTVRDWCRQYDITPESVFRRLGMGMSLTDAITTPKKYSGGKGKARTSPAVVDAEIVDAEIVDAEIIDAEIVEASTALVVPMTAAVMYDGDPIECVRQGDDVWVSTRRVCEALGIDRRAQQRRIAGSAWARAAMITVQDQASGPSGVMTAPQGRQLHMISLDSLPMWLATLDENRVADHVRSKLVRYQKECARVLREHFFSPQLPEPLARVQAAQSLVEMIDRHFPLASDASRQEVKARVFGDLTGYDVRALLPAITETWYSVTQAGEMFGVHATTAGRARVAAGLVGSRAGLTDVRLTKATHSTKQVEQTYLSAQGVSRIGRQLVDMGEITESDYADACRAHGLPVAA